MSTARESAVRLLQLMMIASVVLPTALFAYASWVSYRDISAVADERIFRSLDVMQEQSLKVFGTVDRTFAEVNEIVRGMSDEEIRAAEPRLHLRLAGIVATMPQLHATLLIGRDGRPLVASTLAAVPDSVNFSDRDYFQAQLMRDTGTYVSDMRAAPARHLGRFLRSLAAPGIARRRLQWRHRGGGAAELFRGFLRAHRPGAR
jgi:two-component system NtrC family sensor kinase